MLVNGSVGSRPSGVAGTSARLNQSAGIASYVTLRRSTSTAAVKVRVPSWSQNWNQPAENESDALVFLVRCLASVIYATSPERTPAAQRLLNNLLYGPHKAVRSPRSSMVPTKQYGPHKAVPSPQSCTVRTKQWLLMAVYQVHPTHTRRVQPGR